MCLNHSELVHKHPTHLASSVLCVSCRFAVLEPPEVGHKHPKHLANAVLVCFV